MIKLQNQIIYFILMACLLNGCSKTVEQQIAEQLDLGQKYLSEQQYTEAIVAFQKVIELDDKNVEAYWGLSDVYMAMDDREKAISALENGYKKTQDNRLKERLDELNNIIGSVQEEMTEEEEAKSVEEDKKKYEYDENGRLVRQNYYDDNGNLTNYCLYVSETEADIERRINDYLADGTFTGYTLYYSSEDGLRFYSENFSAEGKSMGKSLRVLDESGKWIYSAGLNPDGSEQSRNEAIYDRTGKCLGWDSFRNGELQSYARYQDETIVYYNKDGTIKGYGNVE